MTALAFLILRLMSRSLPPLTWFRAFDAAARHLSFTLAAEELGFTQSAISQHVRALEDRLGTQLFIRGNRALMLTDAGRLLLPDVAAAMATLTAATQRFLPEQHKPTLMIATSASIAHWVLAPNIAEFQRAYPDVALQIVTTVWPDDFVATNADIEIRFGPESVVGRNATLLEPSFLHAVLSPRLAAPLKGKPPVQWLGTVPLIQPVGLSTGWSEIGRRHRPALSLEASFLVDTHGMAVDLALGHAGVALCHGLITREALRRGELIEVDLPRMDAKEGYYLAAKSTQLPEAQARFLSWVKSVIIR
jgi:LysR family transcriptional regulator, glycine cleavage system transcriptional activator